MVCCFMSDIQISSLESYKRQAGKSGLRPPARLLILGFKPTTHKLRRYPSKESSALIFARFSSDVSKGDTDAFSLLRVSLIHFCLRGANILIQKLTWSWFGLCMIFFNLFVMRDIQISLLESYTLESLSNFLSTKSTGNQ